MIGETVFVSGLAMFLTAPIAGRLTTKVDPRFMLAARFLSFAVGGWLMTYITSDWDFWELVHRQGVVMAFADVFFLLMLLFVALAGLAIVVKRPAAA
jgi:DHA2 family multidrug resistance protein